MPGREEQEDQPVEGSMTVDPLTVWGTWMASRHAESPAPRPWVVLAVVLGLPVLLAVGMAVLVLLR